MAAAGSRIACAPLIYGYVNYAMPGFRPNRLGFADIAAAGSIGPVGSALGGTGIAVSAFSAVKDEAIDFAYWIASGDITARSIRRGRRPARARRGVAGRSRQRGNGRLLSSDMRETLEGAWLRPRHDGYMGFQQAASDRINEGLIGTHEGGRVIDDLNRLFRESFGRWPTCTPCGACRPVLFSRP